MKNITSLVVAAVLGSIITLGAYKAFDLDKRVVEYNGVNTPVQQTVFKPNTTTPSTIPNVAANIDFTNAAAKAMPAVVHIRSTKMVASRGNAADPFRDYFGGGFPFFGSPNQPRGPQTMQGTGSGVIISDDGLIVTNNHVVDGADELEVTLYDNRSYAAQLIGTDPTTDLAVLKIEEKALPILALANSDEAKVGEWVLAVGNPFNLTSTVTAGIVSAKARNISILRERAAIESFIQTDAAVNPGNSGGALINTNGDLLGINTAIATETGAYQGYSFAIPINIVTKVVDDLINFGTVQRGYLGVMIRDLNGNLATELDLDISQGVYVDNLMDSGSAKDAGIKIGDVIVEVDGHEVKSSPELQELIGRKRPGDIANVVVHRNGKMKAIPVQLKNLEGNTDIVSKDRTDLLDKLGADFEELSSEESEKLEVAGGIKVTELYQGLLSQNTDIRTGFIITKVNGSDVSSITQLNDALASSRGGGIMIEGTYEDYPGIYYYAFGLK